MKKPDISVVVCSYNGAKTIGSCIESLLDQDFEGEYDIHIVDDGSTDDTAAIADSFEDNIIELKKHKENRGLGAARNTGWKNSSGTVVAYIDDDAVAPPDWLAKLWEWYKQDVDAVGGLASTYYNDLIGNYEVARTAYIYDNDPDSAPGMNMSFQRSVLEEIGGFDESFTHIGDDADINRRLNNEGFEVVVDENIKVNHQYARTLRKFCQIKFKRGLGRALISRKYNNDDSLITLLLKSIIILLNIPQSTYDGLKINKIAGEKGSLSYIFLRYLEEVLSTWGELYFRLKLENDIQL